MKIRWRLTIFNALTIGAILLALGLALFFLLRGALLSGIEETVQSRAVVAAREVSSGEKLDESDDELTLDGVFIIVRDERGRILSQTVNIEDGKDIRDSIWQRAVQSGHPEGGEAEVSPEGPDYVYAVPVDLPNGSTRVVEAGKSYDSVEDIWRPLRGS